jgi:hypothetical protein
MSKRFSILVVAVLFAWANAPAMAQQQQQQRPNQQGRTGGPQQGNRGGQGGGGGNNNNNNDVPEVKLPDDPRLLDIHKNFVLAAEKLGAEYETKNQIDKARACYEEILRLVPSYTPAAEKLAAVKQKEATAEHHKFDVFANKGWQDAGVGVATGKPVSIKASGEWTMKISYPLSPDGIEIPKELQNFPLGALVCKIAASPTDEEAKVILVGTSKSFTAESDGRLFFRMYDADPVDNLGKITVYLEGTFKK